MHVASPAFWKAYDALPMDIRQKADAAFKLLQHDPQHPSLRFKQVGRYWSARIDQDFRAVAVKAPDAWVWFWIGRHRQYERLIK